MGTIVPLLFVLASQNEPAPPPASPAEPAPLAAAADATPSAHAAAAPDAATPAVAADDPLPAWLKTIQLGAFVDVYGALDVNLPADHVSFGGCCGSSAKRANEFALNLAGVDISAPAAPVGGKLQLVVGNGTEFLHAGEPAGTAVGADAFKSIYQAYVSVAPPSVEGLTIDAGVFSSHIGFEGFVSNANWNYTRAYLGETVPYYQTGVRAIYAAPMLSGLTLQLHVLNGWQVIADNNDAKSFGASVGYSNDSVTASVNGWAGPELAGDIAHWRFLVDSVLVLKPMSWLAIAASADVGHQQLPGAGATWWGAAVYGRVAPLDWLAVAARVEHFDDPDAGITGAAQALNEATLTVELIPVKDLTVKLEARGDQSNAEVFSAGDGEFSTTQTLVLVGAVASF